MKVKVKFVGKVRLVIGNATYVKDGVYSVEKEVAERWADRFEVIEVAKPKPAGKAAGNAATKEKSE